MVRGLFEYVYTAEGLTLVPHVPPGITRLEQHFPIRFGDKRLYLATAGSGTVTAVSINGKPWDSFDEKTVFLPYGRTPERAVIQITLGDAAITPFVPKTADTTLPPVPPLDQWVLLGDRLPVISSNQLPLRIGADPHGTNQFLGEIARVRIFSRALSAKEIAVLAANEPGRPAQDESLLGDWTFENREGNVFPNALGSRLPAKIVGQLEVVDSPLGKAIRLTGKGFLEIAHDASLNLNQGGTLSAWVRPEAMPSGGGRIIDKCGYGMANGYVLDTHPGNSLRLITERGSPTADAKLAKGKWTHVAGTANADGTLSLYVDGKLAASQQGGFPIDIAALRRRAIRIGEFYQRLVRAGLGDGYEARHAKLAVEYLAVCHRRLSLLAEGKLKPLESRSQYAADKSYFDTTSKLCEGLEKLVQSFQDSDDPRRKQIHRLWTAR